MINLLIICLTFLSGIGVSSQAAINGGLGKTTGAIEGAFISFFIGTMGLLFVMLFFGRGNVLEVFSVPKWQLFGGLLGAVYIAILTIAVPRVGVGLAVVAVVCGQMLMSMVIDHYGLFHSKQIPINTERLIGVLLLIAALVMIYRGSSSN